MKCYSSYTERFIIDCMRGAWVTVSRMPWMTSVAQRQKKTVLQILIYVYVFCFSHGWCVGRSGSVVCMQTGLQSSLPALTGGVLQPCQLLLLLSPDLHRLPGHR